MNRGVKSPNRKTTGRLVGLSLTARLDVVGPQRLEIANVKPAVRNDRVRKRFLRHLPRLFFPGRIWRSEATLIATDR